MKHFYHCGLFLWSCFALAQAGPKDTLVDEDLLYIQKVRPFVKAEYGFGALSNSVSTAELVNFVSTDFLEQTDKEAILNSIDGPLRFGYFREIGFAYQQPGYRLLDIYKEGQGFSVKNKYYNSASLNHDLLELIFYGNKPYAGETLELGPSKYETWYYTSLNYNFDLMLDSLQPLALTVGLNVGHDYTFYHVKTGDLYTEPDGAYLDMDLDYRLRDRILEAQAIAGLGLSLGAKTNFRISNQSELEVMVDDLGFIVWTGTRSVDADSSFRFKGVEFENIFDLNDSITSQARNEYEESFYYNEEGNFTRLTPFRISTRYFHKTNDRPIFKGYSVMASYTYLAGYYPRLSVGAHFKTGYKQRLVTSLSTGGYNLASLDLAYEITFFKSWKLNLGITNFSGLVVPVISGGAYGMVALSYEL